jgi:hypothetical protein
MDRWVGISIGLIIAIILVVLYMYRTTSGFAQQEKPGTTTTEVVPTQIPGVVSYDPEPSPVISVPVVDQSIPSVPPNSTDFEYPASLTMSPFNFAEYDGPSSNVDVPVLPVLPGPPVIEEGEDIEIVRKEKYSEWTQ